jgi:two-component system, LytTR family, response regulator LytT
MLRIAIIEDEKLTALDLADTLKKVDNDIEIVTILPSVKKAIDFFKAGTNLDLIFADIQLPDGLSFDIFRNVQLSVPVIFCTAFDQYALESFDSNGIDYLLKPFNKTSVSKALAKYQTLKSKFSDSDNSYSRLLQLLGPKVYPQATSIIVHKGDKIIPIETKEIALFYLEDDYVFALTFDLKKHIISQTLEEIENICGISFFRANRQYLVNRKAVKDASHYINRKIIIHLNINYQEQILVGKLKTSSFIGWLSQS